MRLPPRGRQILLALVSLAFLWFAWNGIDGGVREVSYAPTRGTRIQSILQIVNGLFALLSVVTLFSARRWNALMLIGWMISAMLTAGLATVFWGGASVWVGLASGAGGLILGWVMSWLLRFAARDLVSAGQMIGYR